MIHHDQPLVPRRCGRRWPLNVTGWLAAEGADRATRCLFRIVLAMILLILGAQLAHQEHRGREERLRLQRDAALAQLDALRRNRIAVIR